MESLLIVAVLVVVILLGVLLSLAALGGLE